MDTPRSLEMFQGSVQAEMRRLLAGHNLPLYDMIRYHMGWVDAAGQPTEGAVGGKGLRSTLCLLSTRAVGGDTERALPVAASLDLVHNFSLIHDDIQDRSPERHRRPTVWKLWGDAQAINAGDSLFTLGRLAIYGLLQHDLSAEKVLKIERTMDETCLRLVEGQYLDLVYESRLDITEEDYQTMIGGKTAALMETSCYLGAFVGTEDPVIAQCFKDAGRHLGYAFQIRDDVLGIWGQAAEMGKPVAEDIYNRKKTLPAVYALAHTEGRLRQELHDTYLEETVSDAGAQRALEIFDVIGARSYAQTVAERHQQAAIEALERTGLPQGELAPLKELARFAVEREF